MTATAMLFLALASAVGGRLVDHQGHAVTVMRAVCVTCLKEHRAPGQLRCTGCHQAWLARQHHTNPTEEITG